VSGSDCQYIKEWDIALGRLAYSIAWCTIVSKVVVSQSLSGVTAIERKRALTTGQVAKYCGVNFRTVIRWIERGWLKAYKLPGRGDNRIHVPDFLEFVEKHGMGVPEEFVDNARRVLIVEDEPKLARAIQLVLAQGDFESRIAENGFQAGVMLSRFAPSVMTLDLWMPGLSGLEVLEFVRRQERFSSVKILVVSAMPMEDLEKARAAGADDVMTKPFHNADILARVKALAGVPVE